MTRTLTFAAMVLGLTATVRAEVPVAPPPREVRADGSRDPVPPQEVVKKENPLEVVERIIKNSKDVGDKLAMTDTGTDTRKTQDKILKDIDALLNQDDPPPKDDQNKDQDKDKKKDDQKDKDNKSDPNEQPKKDMNPMGGMGDPKKDMEPAGGMADQQPMGGDQPKQRRPRQSGDEPKEKEGKGGEKSKEKQPTGGQPKQPPKDPAGGKTPDPSGGKPQPNQVLPFEEEVAKDVWGHLPDKLRQQATQYYKQEFMPRYSDLLRLYYSSLAEKK